MNTGSLDNVCIFFLKVFCLEPQLNHTLDYNRKSIIPIGHCGDTYIETVDYFYSSFFPIKTACKILWYAKSCS